MRYCNPDYCQEIYTSTFTFSHPIDDLNQIIVIGGISTGDTFIVDIGDLYQVASILEEVVTWFGDVPVGDMSQRHTITRPVIGKIASDSELVSIGKVVQEQVTSESFISFLYIITIGDIEQEVSILTVPVIRKRETAINNLSQGQKTSSLSISGQFGNSINNIIQNQILDETNTALIFSIISDDINQEQITLISETAAHLGVLINGVSQDQVTSEEVLALLSGVGIDDLNQIQSSFSQNVIRILPSIIGSLSQVQTMIELNLITEGKCFIIFLEGRDSINITEDFITKIDIQGVMRDGIEIDMEVTNKEE